MEDLEERMMKASIGRTRSEPIPPRCGQVTGGRSFKDGQANPAPRWRRNATDESNGRCD